MPMRRELYPADWDQRSRAAIARAGGKCERCGAPNHAIVVRRRGHDGWRLAGWHGPGTGEYQTTVVLTVHHKIAARDGGSHEPGNLEALCQLHHLRADGASHARNAAETRARKRLAAKAGAGQEELA